MVWVRLTTPTRCEKDIRAIEERCMPEEVSFERLVSMDEAKRIFSTGFGTNFVS